MAGACAPPLMAPRRRCARRRRRPPCAPIRQPLAPFSALPLSRPPPPMRCRLYIRHTRAAPPRAFAASMLRAPMAAGRPPLRCRHTPPRRQADGTRHADRRCCQRACQHGHAAPSRRRQDTPTCRCRYFSRHAACARRPAAAAVICRRPPALLMMIHAALDAMHTPAPPALRDAMSRRCCAPR